MQLIEVNNRKTIAEFHETGRVIYKGDPNWVCPPDPVIEGIFNPSKNNFFGHGEAARWILKDDSGQLIGRVAAFINHNKAFKYQQPTGGMGFFECINNKEAAFKLFDQCRDWLSARGMEAMDGPINFGENDNFWGLLVEGFMPQSYGMNYNYPYYQELFEEYGFKMYFEQVSNHLDLIKSIPDRFWKIADWVRKKPELRFEHFRFSETERYIRDLKTIYDSAWAFHESFTPIEPENLRKVVLDSKLLIEEDLIWFVYHEDEPAAFLIMLPDANQVFRHLSGKMHLLDKIKAYYYFRRKNYTRGRVTIMGVVPKYQRHGLESGIFWHLNEAVKKKPLFVELELSWVGDFNPKMRSLHESLGGTFGKRHYTYRRLFREDLDFQRSQIIPMDTKEKALKEDKN